MTTQMDTPIEPKTETKITRRGLFRAAAKTAVRGGILCGALSGGTLAYATQVSPASCRFSRFDLPLAHLPRAFDGYRVAHLTDLHLDEEPDKRRLFSIFDHLNRWQPDVVLLTGDYVSNDPQMIAANFKAALQTLRTRDGVFATMGNHDHWAGPRVEILRDIFAQTGVRELCNDVATIERGGAQINLAGIDSLSGKPDLNRVLERLPQQRTATILLMHEPDFADTTAPTGRFDLQLSGHSHGGQVAIPFHGPLILPRGGRKYHTGFYSVAYETNGQRGVMTQFTSRGTGSSGMRIRFNCPPEVGLFTLRCA